MGLFVVTSGYNCFDFGRDTEPLARAAYNRG